ncbi:MAG: DUF4097 domain-containing protein [Oscillospiraceae bacterium]|nr:DUF4097 domain-containing protein [Oscillospiraceae bacterium]
MSEEKIKILEMLENGKITADDAVALLKQLKDDGGGRHDHYRPDWKQRIPHYHYRPDFGWIGDLRSAFEETASTIGEAVRDAIGPNDVIFSADRETFSTSAEMGGEILELSFEGKNAPVRLESHWGDKIEVEAHYKAKSQWNPRFALNGDNGVYSLSYDENALYMLGIDIRVPETAKIGTIRLKNKNSSVTVNNIKAERIEASTKNAFIKVSGCKGGFLLCETKNAPVILDDIQTHEIEAQTSNAKITLENTDSNRVRLITTCAKIEVQNSDIVKLTAKTSESSLRFEGLGFKKEESVYSMDAITTNGRIAVMLPRSELCCKLRASAALGGVFCELSDLEYKINEEDYAEAQTRGYETARNKLNLNLQTTRHGIYIKQ